MISPDILEDAFGKVGNQRSKGISVEQFESALSNLGTILTSREIQCIFADINRNLGNDDFSRITVNEIVLASKRGGTLKSSRRNLDFEGGSDVLIPEPIISDIIQSIQSFMKVTKASLSTAFKVSLSHGTTALSKAQYAKLMEQIGCQLEETQLNLLFEIFDVTLEDSIAAESLLLFCYTISATTLDVSLEPYQILSHICQKRRLTPKDFLKNLVPYETNRKGYITVEAFEGVLKKFAGNRPGITSSQMSDLLKYFDPDEENRIDIGLFQTFLTTISVPQRIEEKFKHFLKLMRIKELTYQSVFNSYPGKISCDDLIEIVNKLRLPLIEGEVAALFSKLCDKNKQLTIKSFLELMEKENLGASGTSRMSRLLGSKNATTESKENEFCKKMYQKLCQLRSNESKRDRFREGILQRDPDLNGRITIRELERTIEKYVDFTEAEFNLLAENLCFIDGNFKKDIDYSFLLLVLFEPIHKSQAVMEIGKSVMSKMLTSDDSVNLRRLVALLFRNFASFDDRKSGMITIGSAESVLKEEIRQEKDQKDIYKLLTAFQDPNSDCILYPELLSFLSSCSLWNVMYRLHLVDKLRKKQGYNIADHLLKITAKNKLILTKDKLSEIFLSIGILMTDTALDTLFKKYRYQNKDDENPDSIDARAFVRDLSEMESSGDMAPTKKDRKDISAWEQKALTDDGKCQIKETLLKKYDARMLKAIDLAFDLFDQNSRNEIAALDIERVLCALGQKPTPAEIEMLLDKIDPTGKDILEYNTFMDVVLPYIRGKYDETFLPSLQRLQEAFRAFDYNKDGTVSYGEFKYILSLQSEEVDESEADALLRILDTNDNGIVEWVEFAEMYQILRDENAMLDLDVSTRSALRKVRIVCTTFSYFD